jgi:hypothetical protein
MDQDDPRAKRVGKLIQYFDDLRRQGFRHTEISIDAYEALLMENLTLQMTQREWVKQHAQMLARYPQPIVVQRNSTLKAIDEALLGPDPNEQVKMVDPGQDPMINCDHCHGRHSASMECPFDPANKEKL